MKKLKLRLAEISGTQMFTREQLKIIMGGKPPIEHSCKLVCHNQNNDKNFTVAVTRCNSASGFCFPYHRVGRGGYRTYVFD